MSLENRPEIDYGKEGFDWTNKSMSINLPEGKPHASKIAQVALAAGLVFGGYQLANPERASALQDPVYPPTGQEQLQCEPVVGHGLGTTGGIPTELQGRPTCFNPDGSSNSVIFWCDQVLNPSSPLAELDINAIPLCLEGVNDVNGNGKLGDYNPITPDVGAINNLNASAEAVPTTPAPPAPEPTPEPSSAEAVAILAVTTLFLLFGGRLNATRNYQAGHEDGRAQGAGREGAEIEDAVKSHPKVKKITREVREKEQKRRGIKIKK